MSQDHPQAISFANSYFSLVDGLAPGLEDHLAQNVVLDWFGRIITGRDNVATFMKTHKVASRHVFSSIEPVPGINYHKFRTARNTSRCNANGIHSVSSAGEDLKDQFDFDKLSIRDTVDPENNNVVVVDVDCDRDPVERIADSEGNFANGNVSAPLFAFETTPKTVEEIGDSMEKEPQREEFTGVGNHLELDNVGALVPESSCIMYVEAKGQIEFSKKSAKRGVDVQKWKRQSKIQIAYTITKGTHCPTTTTTTDDRNHRRGSGDRSRNDCLRVNPCRDRDHEGNRDDDDDSEMETEEVSRARSAAALGKALPSLEEITMLSGNLVPNINNEFINNIGDLASDRETFLNNFHNELAMRNIAASLTTPRYVNDRLVFGVDLANSPRCGTMPDPGKENPINGFVFNFRIHTIIYEGNSRCRRSLTREFEVPTESARIAFEA